MASNTLHLNRYHENLVQYIAEHEERIRQLEANVRDNDREVKTARLKITALNASNDELAEHLEEIRRSLRQLRANLRELNEDHGPFEPLTEEE
ncbi:MAG: hypothetical protein AAF840_03785 [Bacteroidota bacterium]